MAERLARAGHRVVVIEQVETPEMLAARNKQRAASGLKRVGRTARLWCACVCVCVCIDGWVGGGQPMKLLLYSAGLAAALEVVGYQAVHQGAERLLRCCAAVSRRGCDVEEGWQGGGQGTAGGGGREGAALETSQPPHHTACVRVVMPYCRTTSITHQRLSLPPLTPPVPQESVVQREKVAVLTRGTLTDAEMLSSQPEASYLMALAELPVPGEGRCPAWGLVPWAGLVRCAGLGWAVLCWAVLVRCPVLHYAGLVLVLCAVLRYAVLGIAGRCCAV